MSSPAPACVELGFDLVAHADPAALILVSVTGRIIKANPAAQQDYGLDAGANLYEFVQECDERLKQFLVRASGTREAIPAAFALQSRREAPARCKCLGSLARPASSNEGALLLLRFLPQDQGGRAFLGLTEIVNHLNREVQQRREAQRALEDSLREKETLLQELQHRVRNNLQLLLSMMGIRIAEGNTDLIDFRDRIFAIAAVQELLHTTANLTTIDGGQLVEQLCERLQEGPAPPEVRINTEVDKLYLNTDKAVALGLILNELVTNALKHAFPKRRSGEVMVRLLCGKGFGTLIVSDNGIGSKGEITRSGLGSKVLGAMARNLNADVSRFDDNGTTVVLRFPVDMLDWEA